METRVAAGAEKSRCCAVDGGGTGAGAFCARRWTRWWSVAVAAERGCCDWYVAGDAKEEDCGGSARLLLCAKVAGMKVVVSGELQWWPARRWRRRLPW